MRNFAVLTGFALAVSGCTTWLEKPRQCFSDESPISPTTPGELKALRFVEQRVGRSCRPAGIECNLQLRNELNGNISITASRAFLEGIPPRCTHLDGSFETYIFSSEGKYIRVELGL
jgi:hypothetical protein